MKNYIEFLLDKENNIIAIFHLNGQKRVVRNQQHIKILLSICKEKGYQLDDKAIIATNVSSISKEYEKRVKRQTALIILGSITSNMTLSRKNPALNRRIVAATLAGILTVSGIAAALSSKKDQGGLIETEPTGYYTTCPQPEYPDNTPVVTAGTDTVIDIVEHLPQEEKDDEEEEDQIIDITSSELGEMLPETIFHYSYEDRSEDACISNARRYDDLFEKYAKRYGLDKNLLAAIAAQESSGNHEASCNVGPAEGLMQIEKSVHVGYKEHAYNFETGEMDYVEVTLEKLQDLETNIQIAAMILQNCLESWDYNIPLALQTYNFGIGNMSKVMDTCAGLEGQDRSDIENKPENNVWLNYRAYLKIGDPKYVEHVLSFLPNNQTITVTKRSGETVSIMMENDYEKTTQMTN